MVRYSAGIVTAYGAAKRAGYTGTYEDFCRQQAGYAENAAAVEQAKTTAVNAANTATTKAGEATTAATAAQTAKAQTEQAASQAQTDISTAKATALSGIDTAKSTAVSAVQSEGQTQTANARAQAQAASQSAAAAQASATTAGAAKALAEAAATNAATSATNAATSATNAAQSASDAQAVLESIPEDYSDLSEDVDKLKADLGEVTESGKNLLYSQTWTPVSASINFANDKIIITALSNGTYKTANVRFNVTDTDAVTVSWESKESTSEGTYPASVRVGKIVNDSINWIQYITTSPTTIDTSEIDTLIFGLYVAQGQSSIGDYATFTKLQLEKGSVATEFSQISKIAVDYVAREKIGELQEKIFPSVSIVDANLKVLNDTNLWEAGTISSTGENSNNSKSVRLKNYFPVDNSKRLYFQAYYTLPDSRVDVANTSNASMKNPYICQYDAEFNHIGRLTPTVKTVLEGGKFTLNSNCKYVRFAFYTDLSNADISTIMPSTIFVDAVGDDMWLPPYYDEYLSEKADVITHFMRNEVYNTTSEKYEKIYDPDANLISFIFITDNHYTDPTKTTQYNQMRSPAIIKRLAEKVDIHMVFDGGDVDHSGLWTDLFTVPLRQAFDGEIHYAVGNHEFLSRNTGTNLYYDMDSLNDNQIGSADHHYYYVDNPQLKLRILVLASNMESQAAMGTGSGESSQVGYTTEQETWVNDVALATLPSGWNIIVFTHFFYGVNGNTGNPSLSHGSTILAALANNPAVIAVFQGHTHFDRIVKGHDSVAGTLPIIITSCDKNIPHTSESVYPVNRSTGTVFEQLMDVVVINRSTRTINLIRVGGKALDGVNDNIGSETEIRTVTYGD